MSYFDDHEDGIIFGRSPGLRREPRRKPQRPFPVATPDDFDDLTATEQEQAAAQEVGKPAD